MQRSSFFLIATAVCAVFSSPVRARAPQQTPTFVQTLQRVDIPAKQVRAMSVPLQDAFVAAVHSIEATADLLRDFIILWQPVLTKKEKPSQAALASFEARDDLGDEQRSAVGAFHAYATELSMNNLQTLLVEHKGMVSVGAAAVLAGVIALVMSRGGENDPSVVSKEKKTPSPVVRTPVPPATSPVVVPPAPRDTKAIEAAFDRFFAKRRHIKAFKRFFDERGRVTSDPLLDATAIGALSAELQAEVRRYVNDFNAQMADAEKRVGVRSKRGQRVAARLLFEEIVTAHHDTPEPDDTPAAQTVYFDLLGGWCTQLSDMLVVLDPDNVLSKPLAIKDGKKVMRTAQKDDVVPKIRELLATVTARRDAMAEKLPELKKKQWLDGDDDRMQALATQSDIDVLRGMVFQEPPVDAGITADVIAARRDKFEEARQQRIAAIDYAQNSWMAKIEAAMEQIGGAVTMRDLALLSLPTPDDILTEDGKLRNAAALSGKEKLVATLRSKAREVQEGRLDGVRADLEAAGAALEQLVNGDVAVRMEAAQVQVQEAEQACLVAVHFAGEKASLFAQEKEKRAGIERQLDPLKTKLRKLRDKINVEEEKLSICRAPSCLVQLRAKQADAQTKLDEANRRLKDVKEGKGNWNEFQFRNQKVAAIRLLKGYQDEYGYHKGLNELVSSVEADIRAAEEEKVRLQKACMAVRESMVPLTQQRKDEAPAYEAAEQVAKRAGVLAAGCQQVVEAAKKGLAEVRQEVATGAMGRLIAPDWEHERLGVAQSLLAKMEVASVDALVEGTGKTRAEVAALQDRYKKQVVAPWLEKLSVVKDEAVGAIRRHYAAFAVAYGEALAAYEGAGGREGGAQFDYTQVNEQAKAIMGCDIGDAYSWDFLVETGIIDGPEVKALRRLVRSLDALGLSPVGHSVAFGALIGEDVVNDAVREWRTMYAQAEKYISDKCTYNHPDAVSLASDDEDLISDGEESVSDSD